MSSTIKKIRHIEGIRVFTLDLNNFNRGAAFTIPGIGIFVGIRQAGNIDLLRHEFGHVLQRRQKGFLYFWIKIVPTSLWSAFRASNVTKHVHMHTWTEWSANSLSYDYFNQPATWDFDKYPVHPAEF